MGIFVGDNSRNGYAIAALGYEPEGLQIARKTVKNCFLHSPLLAYLCCVHLCTPGMDNCRNIHLYGKLKLLFKKGELLIEQRVTGIGVVNSDLSDRPALFVAGKFFEFVKPVRWLGCNVKGRDSYGSNKGLEFL